MSTVSASANAGVVIAAKTHYSAAEIAALRLPGLPSSIRGIEKAAARGEWPYREAPARGGRTGTRREYAVASLPVAVRQALAAHSVSAAPVAAAPRLPDIPFSTALSGELTDTQRQARDARAAVLAAIRRLQADAAVSQEAAMVTLITQARAGRLDTATDALLRSARDGRGRKGDGYPSVRTLKRWLGAGDLAPKMPVADMRVPAWAADFLREYRKPQKPCVTEAYEVFAQQWPGVSIHQVRRFLEKLGEVERNRGRMLPRELKALKPFVRRGTDGLLPGDIYTADGHTFDAEIEHPDHGRPFRPEITGVVDIATRRLVGWSAGLAESTWTVLDAQRHAFTRNGLCAIWYVDRGAGFANALQADEVLGVVERMGIRIEHSLPYNSQARGAMERNHPSVWIRAAKKLPTYMGRDMDREARQKVFKITRAALKDGRRSELLMAWRDFLAFIEAEAEAYNTRPHSSLPRIIDPETGRRRHQSPNEAWQAAVAQGWQPDLPRPQDVQEMFRPYKVATVRRGEVVLQNNIYFAKELHDLDLHGEKVRVGYDIHDPSSVVIRDMDGRYICTAELDGNKRGYFPQSVIEQARDKRAAGRERRLQDKLEEVRAERDAGRVLEHTAGPGLYDPLLDIPAMRIPDTVESPIQFEDETAAPRAIEPRADETTSRAPEVVQLPGTESRPRFGPDDDADQYRWLYRHPHAWDALDAEWLLGFVDSSMYEALLPRLAYQGVAWTADMEKRAQRALRGGASAPEEQGFEVAAG